jgi:hypothetical protein
MEPSGDADGETLEQISAISRSDSQSSQNLSDGDIHDVDPKAIVHMAQWSSSNGNEVVDLHDVDIQEHSNATVHEDPMVQNISFHDITYKVKQRKHCRRISSKVILNSCR